MNQNPETLYFLKDKFLVFQSEQEKETYFKEKLKTLSTYVKPPNFMQNGIKGLEAPVKRKFKGPKIADRKNIRKKELMATLTIK